MNVVTGITSNKYGNQDMAEDICKSVLDDVIDKTVTEFTFKMNKQENPIKSVNVAQEKQDSFAIELGH